MNILLTGATGFLGSRLRTRLAAKHRVLALARKAAAPERNVRWIEADLQGPFEFSLPRDVDVVAVLSQSRHYRDFPDSAADVFSVNVDALFRLLEWARRGGVQRLVFLSSANVYAQSTQPIAESGVLQPTSFYARSKLMCEMLMESYAPYLHALTARLFTVYGPGQTKMLVPQLMERIATSQAVTIAGECGLELTPIYVDDAIEALVTLIETPGRKTGLDVVNVAGTESTSIRDLAQRLGTAMRMEPRWEFVAGGPRLGWCADTTRLREDWQMTPRVSLADGIARTVAGVTPMRASA